MNSLSRWRLCLILGSAAVMVAACGKKTDTPPRDSTAPTATTAVTPPTDTGMSNPMPGDSGAKTSAMSDGNIVAKLGWADSVEIEQAKLAQTKARSADVKAFAKMMIDDHTKMMKAGKDVATKAGITPIPIPGDPDPAAASAKMDALKGASGAAFDSLYIQTAVEDHTKVLGFINSSMGSAQNADLKAHLDKGKPTVQHHLDEAKALQGKLGGAKGM